MLPTYPDIVRWRREANQRLMKNLVGQKAPFLRGISRHTVHEGKTSTITREDGSSAITQMRQHSATTELKRMPLAEFDSEAVVKHLSEFAEQLAKSMSESLFEAVSEGAESVGNVVDGKGKPLSGDLLVEAFEKIAMDFRDDGSWDPPTIVVSPEQHARLVSLYTAQEMAVFNKRIDKIIERKRLEYRSREAGRVLAG